MAGQGEWNNLKNPFLGHYILPRTRNALATYRDHDPVLYSCTKQKPNVESSLTITALCGKRGTKLHFKSPMAERRHVLCVRVGGDRTDSNPCRTTPEKQGMSALTSRPRRTYGYEASKCEIVSLGVLSATSRRNS